MTAHKKGLSYFLLRMKSGGAICQVMEILPLASFATTVTMSLHINGGGVKTLIDDRRPESQCRYPFNSITTFLTKIASDDVRPPSSAKCL
ncbi:hypothetical protein M405DRAFT_866476 [Rhizopogon salebrosus TDB-379]|nr:hypothetical protein M405DRAFT_866476 [Rhizopogon salebrosus TDB-379]